jgi:hypothetical protein
MAAITDTSEGTASGGFLRIIDRLFGGLLILATVGHGVGTILMTPFLSGLFVWSLGSSLAGFLLGALNLVRAGRPHDRALAAITAIGTIGWIFVCLGFSISIHNLLDPRPLIHEVISAVLVLFSLRTLFGRPGVP